MEYDIDYLKHWYDEDFHEKGLEPKADAFLSQMNYICFLKEKKLIRKGALEIFQYELERVATNPDCLCYLWNISHFSERLGKPSPFPYLTEYVRRRMDDATRKRFDSNGESEGFFKRLKF